MALAPSRASWNAFSFTRADAAFAILGAGYFALAPKKTLFALAESHFLDLVVKTGTMPTAHLVALLVSRGTWATHITCCSTPCTDALALGLAQSVQSALSIFAANLTAQTLRTWLSTSLANMTVLATALGSL